MKRRTIQILVGVLVVGGLGFCLALTFRPFEAGPRYRGLPTSYWKNAVQSYAEQKPPTLFRRLESYLALRNKNGTVLAAVGTHLHGRLLHLEYRSALRSVLFSVAMESIDFKGATISTSVILECESTPTIGFATNSIVPGSLAAAAGGGFQYYGTHFKVDHLDAKGVTTSPTKK